MEKSKLKNKIKEKIDEYDTIRNLIFTTFSLDIPFFETKLLPYLFGIENHKGIRNQEYFIVDELNDKLNKNNTKINVFFDNYIGEYEKIGNYRIKQVKAKGVFHPKLIIIIGMKENKEILTLIVTSANLTTSSYGSNTEVFGIDVLDNNRLIEIKNNSNDIHKIFEILSENNKLILTGFDKKINFLDYLNGKNLKIVTPFITNDMLTDKKFKNAKIILTKESGFSDGNKYNPSLKKLLVLNNSEKEFIHAKIYIMEDKVIVGSHNFTNKALLNINVEASLIIDDTSIVKTFNKWFDNLKTKDYEYLENTETEDEDKDRNNIIVIEDAILDYKTNDIKITLEESDSYQNVRIPKYDLNLNKTKNNIFSYNLNDNLDIVNQIYLNRFFELEIKSNNKLYKAYGTFYIENLPNTPNILYILTTDYFDFFEFAKLKKPIKRIKISNEEENIDSFKKTYDKDKYDIVNIYIFYKNITKELKEDKKNKSLTIYGKQFTSLLENFIKIYNNNFLDENLLNLLLPAKEIENINNFISENLLYFFINKYLFSFLLIAKEIEIINNFINKNLLYFLLTAKEIEIILNKYKINNSVFNDIFEKLKNAAITIIQKDLDINKEKAKALLNIYLKNLEVDYETKQC